MGSGAKDGSEGIGSDHRLGAPGEKQECDEMPGREDNQPIPSAV